MLSGITGGARPLIKRLNRVASDLKHDRLQRLDFLNDADTIHDAFTDYYRATILASETDPDKLHDLQTDLDAAQVYSPEQIDDFVERYLDGAERDQLDPILDACVAVYWNNLDEDGQVDFKGKAKAFVRTYGFLSCVLPYTYAPWEKRSIAAARAVFPAAHQPGRPPAVREAQRAVHVGDDGDRPPQAALRHPARFEDRSTLERVQGEGKLAQPGLSRHADTRKNAAWRLLAVNGNG